MFMNVFKYFMSTKAIPFFLIDIILSLHNT